MRLDKGEYVVEESLKEWTEDSLIGGLGCFVEVISFGINLIAADVKIRGEWRVRGSRSLRRAVRNGGTSGWLSLSWSARGS